MGRPRSRPPFSAVWNIAAFGYNLADEAPLTPGNSEGLQTDAGPAGEPPEGAAPEAAATTGELVVPGRPGWGIPAALPVVLFLLLLAGLSLSTGPEPPATPANVRALLVVQSFFYAVILLYVAAVVSFLHRLPFWQGLCWRRANAGFFVFAGVALSVAVQLLSLPQTRELPIERLFRSAESAYLLAAFGILVAPLVEEIIFRGFVFRAFERDWGLRAAIWITALLFALIHVPQLRGGIPQMLAIFAVGLTLSWVRGRTGSLAAAYFVHLGYNGSLFVLLYIATYGFQTLGAN